MLTWLANANDRLPDTSLAWGEDSDAPGLLAAGHDLGVARLAEAYDRGIFPWYSEGQPVLWWSPDPRMVLPVAEFRLSLSLKKTIRRFIATPGCAVRIDAGFAQVIAACAEAPRAGQNGTWIQPELRDAYTAWHRAGSAHAFETWIDGRLVGGLYGVNRGRMFFGESMFAHATDASKIALAALVAFCRAHDIELIDCQQRTSHLASFGAREIPRSAFEAHLRSTVGLPAPGDWSYHESHWERLLHEPRKPAAPAPGDAPEDPHRPTRP